MQGVTPRLSRSSTKNVATRARPCVIVTASATPARAASASAPAPAPATPAPAMVVLNRIKSAAVAAAYAVTLALAWDCDVAHASVELGKTIFNGNCAACHQGGRNVVVAEKTLDKAALEQYLDGGFNLDAIVYQVENGKGAMPAWGDRLSADEIQSVAEYVYQTASAGAWGSQ